ncbi:hypothetical protein DPMN_073559 [Dreissena polymorpha]|uniref:SRCR domain-containing protein n=1 Tax=Dreissena polymorpha TaxID=45954 RepID=A0A9D4HDE6_DREPO|nr:hypothetical protein DPMN_073559 [Dreissena polymorpha]
MMGYGFATRSNTASNPGTGPIFVDDLDCGANATSINECKYTTNQNCGHAEDVAVRCIECPALIIQGGSLILSATRSGIATLTCHVGWYMNGSNGVFECKDGMWSNSNTTCRPDPPVNITDVRLVGGPSPNVGRVEIAIGGIYGTVCDNMFDFPTADVICKSNNSSLHAAAIFNGAKFGEGSGPIHLDRLNCLSGDTNIKQCKYSKNGHCSHSRDVSVLCSECRKPEKPNLIYKDKGLFVDCQHDTGYVGYLPVSCRERKWNVTGTCFKYEKPLIVEDIRLSNGTYDEEGRVEIKVFDEWGTICDDSFGLEEATVICRMLGYGYATGFNTSVHPGKGPIFVNNLDCGENVFHINDCEYTTMHNCSHSEDVAVTCNAPVPEPNEKANASEVNKNNTATDSDKNPTYLISVLAVAFGGIVGMLVIIGAVVCAVRRFRRLRGDIGETKRAHTYPNPVYEGLKREHDQEVHDGDNEDVFENDQQYVKA